MPMLRSDLQTLKNLVSTREGRSVLLGQAIVTTCVVVGSVALTGGVLLDEKLLDAVRNDTTGEMAHFCYATALVLPILVVLGMGFAGSNNELFQAPQLPTLLSAPISSFAIVGRSFLRMGMGCTMFSLAITIPPILGLAARTELPATPVLMAPVAVALLVAPTLAAQCLLKVVFVRWCSGLRVRQIFLLLNVLFLTGLTLLAGFGLVKGSDLAARLTEVMQNARSLPWYLDAPAGLLSWSAGLAATEDLARRSVGLATIAVGLLGFTAFLYRAAVEAFWVAGTATPPAKTLSGPRAWPGRPLPSLLKKTFLESLRVRSNVIGYGLIAFLMVLTLSVSGEVQPHELDRTPRVLSELFHVWLPWHGLILLISCISFLAVIGEEQKQIALLAMAPVSRRLLLWSKILSVAAPFLACAAIVLVASSPLQATSWSALGLFALVSLPIVLFTLGLLAMVGTWPAFTQIHRDVPLASNLRSVIPVLVIGGTMSGAMLGLIKIKYALKGCYNGHGWLSGMDPTQAGITILALLWVIGGLSFALFCRLGRRNLDQLLGPQSS